MEERVLYIVRELQDRLRSVYGSRLLRIVVFGSQARGDSKSESDIDVLVVLAGNVEAWREISRTSKDVAAISLMHDVVLSCVFMAQVDFEARQASPLLLNVRREGVEV